MYVYIQTKGVLDIHWGWFTSTGSLPS